MNDQQGTEQQLSGVEQEAVRICRELIQIDSSNYGDGTGPGEREAAEYVVGLLQEVGLEPTLIESEPGRASVIVRLEGADSGSADSGTAGANAKRPGLVLHGHLDVVPANAADWQVGPFSGEIHDGCIWGRGAVDMKNMDAMILANVRDMVRAGVKPPRDLVVAFFADEEAGGAKGAQWLVQKHPELFEGCSEAISEVGGYSITVPEKSGGGSRRAYLLQTAEKGFAWIKLHAHGRAGHGSVPNDENALARLADAMHRIGQHVWPREYVASVRQLMDGVSEISGVEYSVEDCSELMKLMGGARGFVEGTLQDTAAFTMLSAGYKHNVIPQTATAALDCRFLPGHEDILLDTIRELAGEHVEVEVDYVGMSLDAPFDGTLVEQMKAALRAEDPDAEVLPYCLSGGTDNKALKRLGITGYGFAPLQLPPDLNFAALFHGIDERVPIDSLTFGTRVLGRLLRDC